MMKTSKIGRILVVLGILVCASLGYAKNVFTIRTVCWPSAGLGNAAGVQAGEAMLSRMNKVGYNGLLLDGAMMRNLHKNTANAARVKGFAATARSLGIQIIPMGQYQTGSPFTPDGLREALPNKGTPFVVSNGIATAKGDPTVLLKNPGFEQPLSGTWGTQKYFKIDNTIKHSGSASVRCDDPNAGLVFLSQRVTVKPYRTYELSAWVRSQDVKMASPRHQGWNPMSGTMFTVRAGGQYILCNREWSGVPKSSNWHQFKMYFCSLQHASVDVWLHATYYYKITGKIWFDDVTIREMGLTKTVTRPSMPVVVKTIDGKELVEGKDYTVGKGRLTIPTGSVIKNGDELLVDWHTEGNMFSAEAEAAFCYNEIYDSMRRELEEEDKVFGVSPVKMMKYDEWRMAGWDPSCMQRYNIGSMGSGKYMADVANNTAAIYKEANGSRIALAWNDPFDPYHNSKEKYKLVHNGNLGSGHYLSEDIIIVNWCGNPYRQKSLKYFAGTNETSYGRFGVKTTKQRQIISTTPGGWNDWLSHLSAVEAEGKMPDGSVIGINYHTYAAFPMSYKRIEEMATACKAVGRWETGPMPIPAVTPGIPWKGLPPLGPIAISGKQKNIGVGSANLRASLKGSGALRRFSFHVPKNENVRVSIVNLHGQKISTIMNEQMAAGFYERKIDVSKMASGVYFAQLTVNEIRSQSITRKMIVF